MKICVIYHCAHPRSWYAKITQTEAPLDNRIFFALAVEHFRSCSVRPRQSITLASLTPLPDHSGMPKKPKSKKCECGSQDSCGLAAVQISDDKGMVKGCAVELLDNTNRRPQDKYNLE